MNVLSVGKLQEYQAIVSSNESGMKERYAVTENELPRVLLKENETRYIEPTIKHGKQTSLFTKNNKSMLSISVQTQEYFESELKLQPIKNSSIQKRDEKNNEMSPEPSVTKPKDKVPIDCTDLVKIGTGVLAPNVGVQSSNLTSDTSADLKTFEDALKYFGLTSRLEKFERSLEDVRRNKMRKEEHELNFKQFDKEILNLSFKYHPDKVRHREGSDDEIEKAQKLQSALNAIRMTLSFLNKRFLEELDIDHKYQFYSKLNISSLGNEDEIESHVYEVAFKISFISEIKQQNITAEIRKFLEASQSCIRSFMGDKVEFEMLCYSAIYHLNRCVIGYEKLLKECKAVEKECKEENMESISSLISKMKKDSLEQLNSLKKLSEIATRSLEGTFQIFNSPGEEDNYFVQPFVYYLNVILMCNAMTKTEVENFLKKRVKKFRNYFYELHPLNAPPAFDLSKPIDHYLSNAFYLASYYNGYKMYKDEVMQIMEKEHANKEEIKEMFLIYVMQIKEILEDTFKTDEYNERSSNSYVMAELNNCMKMWSSFHEKADKLSDHIAEFKRENEDMKKECDRIKTENEEISKEVKESLERNQKVMERLNSYLSKQSE